jgi:hypothetical protein
MWYRWQMAVLLRAKDTRKGEIKNVKIRKFKNVKISNGTDSTIE